MEADGPLPSHCLGLTFAHPWSAEMGLPSCSVTEVPSPPSSHPPGITSERRRWRGTAGEPSSTHLFPAHPIHPLTEGRPSPPRLPVAERLLCARYPVCATPAYPNIWSVLLRLTSTLAHWPCLFSGVVFSKRKPADIGGFLPSELCQRALAPISFLHLFATMLALNCSVCPGLGA